MHPDRLLLVTHVPLKASDRGLCIDDQTAQGLVRWCQNFEEVAYAGIALREQDGPSGSSANWVPIADLPCARQLDVLAMPNAYRIQSFMSLYRSGRAKLAAEIARSRYLCFTLGALAGDWAAVAALEAISQRRSYAVWFDRVEHEVVRSDLPAMPLKRRIKETISLPFMQQYHRFLIRRSSLGLFQGKDCYDYYSRFTDAGHCVYDTHTKKADFIAPERLRAKLTAVQSGEPLRICYAGRAADMKGPFDWLAVLKKLREAGVAFSARWLGDGPLLGEMRKIVVETGLAEQVELAGFVSDRTETLDAMKNAHVFLCCHKTPESPRCLIETLVCGTPIVGYRSAYAADLTGRDGGGAFVEVGDIDGLAACLVAFDRDRKGLAGHIMGAARSGLRFDEETVYRHRAGLIRSMS